VAAPSKCLKTDRGFEPLQTLRYIPLGETPCDELIHHLPKDPLFHN